MNIAAERDRVVLAASMRYLMTLHPLLIKVIWQDFLKGIFVDNAKIALSPFYANAYPALDRIRRPEVWATLKGLEALSSVNNFEATRVLDRSKLDPYVLLWHNIPLGVIIALSFLLGGATCIRDKKIPPRVVVGLFAIGAGVVVFAATCVCVPYMPRYSLPLLTTSVFALLTSIAPFADGGPHRIGMLNRLWLRLRSLLLVNSRPFLRRYETKTTTQNISPTITQNDFPNHLLCPYRARGPLEIILMRCGIALGSNIEDRLENLRNGCRLASALHQPCPTIRSSYIYESCHVDCEPGSAPYL
jgi:hypothetical protein